MNQYHWELSIIVKHFFLWDYTALLLFDCTWYNVYNQASSNSENI